jgi:hypothetical protein
MHAKDWQMQFEQYFHMLNKENAMLIWCWTCTGTTQALYIATCGLLLGPTSLRATNFYRQDTCWFQYRRARNGVCTGRGSLVRPPGLRLQAVNPASHERAPVRGAASGPPAGDAGGDVWPAGWKVHAVEWERRLWGHSSTSDRTAKSPSFATADTRSHNTGLPNLTAGTTEHVEIRNYTS